MSIDENGATSNHNPSDPSAPRANGAEGADPKEPVPLASDYVRRVKAFATGLSSGLDDQMKRHPYAMLGVAGVVGMGVGVVLSSRTLRAVARAVASAATVELVRAIVRQGAFGVAPS
jgi:hypothetical protein